MMKTEYYTLHLWGTPERNTLAQAAGQTEHNVPEIRRRTGLDNVVDFTAWKAAHCGEKHTETEAIPEENDAPAQQLFLEGATTWTVLMVGVALLVRILLA